MTTRRSPRFLVNPPLRCLENKQDLVVQQTEEPVRRSPRFLENQQDFVVQQDEPVRRSPRFLENPPSRFLENQPLKCLENKQVNVSFDIEEDEPVRRSSRSNKTVNYTGFFDLDNDEDVQKPSRNLPTYEVEIDFVEASEAWRRNKRSIGNGMFKYAKM
jgi:hypothetical protein